MIRRICFSVIFSLVGLLAAPLQAEKAVTLSKKNIHASIEEMLKYHVEYKSFSQLLVKRSFKLFLEQFDPLKMYLLQSEAAPFWNMSENHLAEVVHFHRKGEYPFYEKANQLIGQAILRARSFREEIKKEILQEGSVKVYLEESSLSFAKTEDVLRERVKRQMLYSIALEGGLQLSREDQEKALALFERRLQKSEDSYLSPKKDHYLAMHTLKAFAKSLDSHSSFFSPEEARELRNVLEKQFEGVGVVLKEGLRGIVVKSLILNGPAQRSGQIQDGDLLLSVDKKSVSSESYQEAMEWLKGGAGKVVHLTFQKKTGEIVSVSLVREKIVMEEDLVHFSTVPYGDGFVGVIEIPSFYESGEGRSCEKDVMEALRGLRSRGTLRGVVLDMRENSGGFLSQAVKVAGLFMSSGVIVMSKYSTGQIQYLRDINGQIFYEGPLVVLTSKASASAAEIVAQALQDYGLALVVGDERTYGKGTIQYQTVTEGGASSFFKVTVGRYYTVSGRSTQIEGVRADVVVPSKYSPFNIGEKYLPYALKNDQVPSAFTDLLMDVDGRSRAWLQKNYLPNLQKKLSHWTEMLPLLKLNSEYRLGHDRNFLCFLQFLKNDPLPLESRGDSSSNFGQNDLQVLEAVNIIKDMTLLQKYEKKTINSRKSLAKKPT